MKRSLDFHRGEGVQIDKTLCGGGGGGGMDIFFDNALTKRYQKESMYSTCAYHTPPAK